MLSTGYTDAISFDLLRLALLGFTGAVALVTEFCLESHCVASDRHQASRSTMFAFRLATAQVAISFLLIDGRGPVRPNIGICSLSDAWIFAIRSLLTTRIRAGAP